MASFMWAAARSCHHPPIIRGVDDTKNMLFLLDHLKCTMYMVVKSQQKTKNTGASCTLEILLGSLYAWLEFTTSVMYRQVEIETYLS